jgi:hypothetical protein
VGPECAGHPRVGDHIRDLAVGSEYVVISVLRQAGVTEDLLYGQGRLRVLRRVLEDDRVACHQVRGGEMGHLVVGKFHGMMPWNGPIGSLRTSAVPPARGLSGVSSSSAGPWLA